MTMDAILVCRMDQRAYQQHKKSRASMLNNWRCSRSRRRCRDSATALKARRTHTQAAGSNTITPTTRITCERDMNATWFRKERALH